MYRIRIEGLLQEWQILDLSYDGDKLMNWDYYIHEPKQASVKMLFDETLYSAIKNSDNLLRADYQEDEESFGLMKFKCLVYSDTPRTDLFTGYVDVNVSTDFKTMDIKLWDGIKILSQFIEKLKVNKGDIEAIWFQERIGNLQSEINTRLNFANGEFFEIDFDDDVWSLYEPDNYYYEVGLPIVARNIFSASQYLLIGSELTIGNAVSQIVKLNIVAGEDEGTIGLRYTNYFNIPVENGLPVTDGFDQVKKISSNLTSANMLSNSTAQENIAQAVYDGFIGHASVINPDYVIDVEKEELEGVIRNNEWDLCFYKSGDDVLISTNQNSGKMYINTNTNWSSYALPTEIRVTTSYGETGVGLSGGTGTYFDNPEGGRVKFRRYYGRMYRPMINGWSGEVNITTYPEAYRSKYFKGRDVFSSLETMNYKDLLGAYLFFNDKQLSCDVNGVVKFRNTNWADQTIIAHIPISHIQISVTNKFNKKENPDALDKLVAPDATVDIEVLNNKVNAYYNYIWNAVNGEYSLSIFKDSTIPELELGDIIYITELDIKIKITEIKFEKSIYAIKGIER